VSDRPESVPPFTLTFGLDIATDLAAVHAVEPAALAAAEAIIDDLAHGRVIGKLLGDRHVSGDLTGLARVKFDVAGQRPQRFRLVYRQVDDKTRDVLAIGLRDEHAIYRLAARRIAP
jgi:hypothetical protein